MTGIGAVIDISIKNNILRSRNLFIIFIGITLIIIVGVAVGISLLVISPTIEKGSPDLKSDLELYLGAIMYAVSLFTVGVGTNAFAAPTMTKEKTRGNIESLLATPLKVKSVWLAKSLAVFLPGWILAWLFTAIALIAINYIYIVPEMGFLLTPWIAISSFVMVPIMYLCLNLLVHLIGLASSPNTANAVVQVFLPVMAGLMMNVGLCGWIDMTSWQFALIHLGIAIMVAIIIFFLNPRLTRERIVLSRRGRNMVVGR